MSDEAVEKKPVEEGAQVPSPAVAQNTDSTMIPKARLDEVLSQVRAANKQLEAASKESERFRAMAEAATEKADGLQVLYDALVPQNDAAQKALEAVWEAKKAIIPAHFLALAERLPLIERMAWIATNEEQLRMPAQGTTQHKLPTGSGETPNPYEGKVRARL